MKKEFTILLGALFFVSIVLGQSTFESDWYLPDQDGSTSSQSIEEPTVEKQRLDKKESTRWDAVDPHSRTEYFYDERYDLSSYVLSTYLPTTSSWDVVAQIDRRYNGFHKVVESVNSLVDDDTETLVKDSRQLWVRGADSLRTEEYLIQIWNTEQEQWDNKTWLQLFYDGDVFVHRDSLSVWDTLSNSWVKSKTRNFYYDESNRLSSYVRMRWDQEENTWKNERKLENSYDDNGYKISETKYNWNDAENEWTNYYHSLYGYDANGNQTEHITKSWDGATDSWLNKRKRINSYSDTYLMEDLIVPSWMTNPNMLTSHVNYDWDIDLADWVEKYTSTFYCSPQEVVGIDVPLTVDSQVFPNPCNDFISFKINGYTGKSHLEMYDSKGQRVLMLTFSGQESIDISFLTGGLYFYKLKWGNDVASGKLIKE